MPVVLVRVEAAGEWPIVVADGESLPAVDGVAYRFVCEVGSIAEGNCVRAAWLTRRLSPEAKRWMEEQRVEDDRVLRSFHEQSTT
jgi:hypothetical protein